MSRILGHSNFIIIGLHLTIFKIHIEKYKPLKNQTSCFTESWMKQEAFFHIEKTCFHSPF